MCRGEICGSWAVTATTGSSESSERIADRVTGVPGAVLFRAIDEVHILLIETAGTPNTGNAETAAARRVI